MNCAAGSVVLPPGEPQRDPAAPVELPAGAGEASGDIPEEGESGGPSAGEGRRGGSDSGHAEQGAAAGDKPETRSVCSSESGSGSHPGGAGPICKICFQGPEQVRRAGRGGGRTAPLSADGPTPLTHTPTRTPLPGAAGGRREAGGPVAGSDQHQGQRPAPPARPPPPLPRLPGGGAEKGRALVPSARGEGRRPLADLPAGRNSPPLCRRRNGCSEPQCCCARWL